MVESAPPLVVQVFHPNWVHDLLPRLVYLKAVRLSEMISMFFVAVGGAVRDTIMAISTDAVVKTI